MARLPELVVLRAPQPLGSAVALVLSGLGQRVLYVTAGRAPLALLPRLPEFLRQRMIPTAQTAVDQWTSHNALHLVESGNPWWQAGVRYADTSGTTLTLRSHRLLPEPDAAPKWQNWCEVSNSPLPDTVIMVRAEQMGELLHRRWLRRHTYAAAGSPPQAQVMRWLDLRASTAQSAPEPDLHPVQQALGRIAWSHHGLAGCRWGLGDLHAQGLGDVHSSPTERCVPWQKWSQDAVLARGSAWWYDACGAVKKRVQANPGAV